jgi:hypothetical protein
MISLLTILIGVLALALIVAGIAAAIAPPRPKRTASVKAAYGRQAERRIRDQLYDTRADLTHHHPRPGPTATIQKRVERPARPPNASPSTRSALARLRTLQAPRQRQLRAGANATELLGNGHQAAVTGVGVIQQRPLTRTGSARSHVARVLLRSHDMARGRDG